MVDYANGEGEPPPELRLLRLCEKWRHLPDAGAPLEQDYVLMYRMGVYGNIDNAIRNWKSLSGKAIHNLSESDRNTLRWLKDEGMIFS